MTVSCISYLLFITAWRVSQQCEISPVNLFMNFQNGDVYLKPKFVLQFVHHSWNYVMYPLIILYVYMSYKIVKKYFSHFRVCVHKIKEAINFIYYIIILIVQCCLSAVSQHSSNKKTFDSFHLSSTHIMFMAA